MLGDSLPDSDLLILRSGVVVHPMGIGGRSHVVLINTVARVGKSDKRQGHSAKRSLAEGRTTVTALSLGVFCNQLSAFPADGRQGPGNRRHARRHGD